MKRHFVHSLFAAGVLLVGASGYAQTPITKLPFTIDQSGKYFLSEDLFFNGGAANAAIEVTAPNVTIDLRGFTLDCFVPNQKTGISVSSGGAINLVIENGTNSDFQGNGGIFISGPGSNIVLNNLKVDSFQSGGISLGNCTGFTISNCQVSKNFDSRSGTSGIRLTSCDGGQVFHDSVSQTNVTGSGRIETGIKSSGGTNYFEDDYINGCVVGISMSATDKYRSITTTKCDTDIIGGIPVDGKSN